jgi:preprotein translocase subunit YajC
MEQQGGFLASVLPLVVLFAIFYFLIIRPQKKQQDAHQEMLDNLAKHDEIITNGGLIVEVVKVEEDYLKVKLNDNNIVKLSKEFVARKNEKVNNEDS